MTRVIVSQDCGNSPKNTFLEKLTKDDFAQALAQMMADKGVELTIHHVVTHGKAGAVNGTLELKGGKTRAFCDVYEFSGAKGASVRAIASYVIETMSTKITKGEKHED